MQPSFFWLSLEISLKSSVSLNFSKFLSKFLYVIPSYTYEQISDMGSNMYPLMVSKAPPVGDTESDMPWEVGLTSD